MANNAISRALEQIPIHWGRYADKQGKEHKTAFITPEKAVYDSNGKQLDEKLATLEGNLSDAFDVNKSYSVGDICIYLNQLYKFVEEKESGAFDDTKAIPITVAEMCNNRPITYELGTVDIVKVKTWYPIRNKNTNETFPWEEYTPVAISYSNSSNYFLLQITTINGAYYAMSDTIQNYTYKMVHI